MGKQGWRGARGEQGKQVSGDGVRAAQIRVWMKESAKHDVDELTT